MSKQFYEWMISVLQKHLIRFFCKLMRNNFFEGHYTQIPRLQNSNNKTGNRCVLSKAGHVGYFYEGTLLKLNLIKLN
jgi:hypothetical protein